MLMLLGVLIRLKQYSVFIVVGIMGMISVNRPIS
jgi:hypothetical protein